jgi:uncharacterized protein (DUF427 family)
MKAMLNGTVVAEAPREDLVKIEGNWYFPPSSVKTESLVESPTQYTCSWKGEAQYFNVHDGTSLRDDVAWSYPKPIPASLKRVGTDFSGYVAFDRKVKITE